MNENKNSVGEGKEKKFGLWSRWALGAGLLFIFIALISTSGNSKPQEKIEEMLTTNSIVATSSDVIPDSKKEEIKQVTTPTKNEGVKVVGVVDGDTIKVSINGETKTLRLIGMDTPETVDPRKPVQCFGKEASNKAKELLSGKNVHLEADLTQGELDKYQRLLRYVFLEDGTSFNKWMIANGYAHEYTYDTPYKYQAEFKAAEKSAREAKLGLWNPNTCNGNTASVSSSPTPVPVPPQSTGEKYYTSSHSSSKYYYPESCDGWKSLSPSYLRSFDSLDALLAAYPSKTKSSQCE